MPGREAPASDGCSAWSRLELPRDRRKAPPVSGATPAMNRTPFKPSLNFHILGRNGFAVPIRVQHHLDRHSRSPMNLPPYS